VLLGLGTVIIIENFQSSAVDVFPDILICWLAAAPQNTRNRCVRLLEVRLSDGIYDVLRVRDFCFAMSVRVRFEVRNSDVNYPIRRQNKVRYDGA
jgi:hypothetical protein